MRLRRKGREGPAAGARSVLASVLPVEGPAGKQAWSASSSDDNWQKQAWYYYDAVGELRFAFNYLANAASRATIYAAETDPETGLISGPTEDARAQAAAQAVLGGADNMPQLVSTMALHWQVAGETYILILPQGGSKPDRWAAVSRNGLRQQGGTWSYKDPLTGVWTKLRSGTDRVLRVWSPHPDDQVHADSAMRAAIPICAEIEKASQNITARLESRLASNGLFFLPQEIDFTTAEGEPANAQTLMRQLMDLASVNISEPGTASAQVPMMADVPGEMIQWLRDGWIDFSSQLDGAVPELREAAVTRLGRTVDMPREVALGQTAEANHWSAWQIEETTYKIHLESFLLKLGMALTKEYYRLTLAAMGETNPDRFVLSWDVTQVVSRPDDTEDDKYLWENRLVSSDYLRGKFGVPDDAIPSEEEVQLRRLEQAVQVAPTLAAQTEIAQTLFGLEISPAAAGVAADAPVGDPGLEPGSEPDPSPRALPTRQGEPPEPDAGLVAAAELVVFDALSRAGGRLLTRQYRGQFASTPKWELHTVIPVEAHRIQSLMTDSFQFSDNIAHAFGKSRGLFHLALTDYVRTLLHDGRGHSRDELATRLRGVRDHAE